MHDDGDILVWKLKVPSGDTGYEIWFGHHGQHFHGGDTIEPAVAITLGGAAVADAIVF